MYYKISSVFQTCVLLFCKHKLSSFLSQQQTLKLLFQKAKYLDKRQNNSRPTKQLTLWSAAADLWQIWQTWQ